MKQKCDTFLFFLYQDVAIFAFDKKSVDRLHKPKRKEAMTELLKTGLGHLMCFRHPKLLHVVHGAEETPETLAFASEPLIGSLANILNNGSSGSLDHGEQKSNVTTSNNCSLLKVDYSFIDVEYRYGFSQVHHFLSAVTFLDTFEILLDAFEYFQYF